MVDVVLLSPQIPPNTGNVMRLCANTGSRLHLVRPLGFAMSDRRLARAGLDYRDRATVTVHADWEAAHQALHDRRMYAVDTGGQMRHTDATFRADDVLVFGTETTGIPPGVLAGFPATRRLRLEMVSGSRSLNLSNTVAVVVYEAWRQNGYIGAL